MDHHSSGSETRCERDAKYEWYHHHHQVHSKHVSPEDVGRPAHLPVSSHRQWRATNFTKVEAKSYVVERKDKETKTRTKKKSHYRGCSLYFLRIGFKAANTVGIWLTWQAF